MNINLDLLDKRYKKTILYIKTKQGTPIYKKSAFKSISKILGKQHTWINVHPNEYFGDGINSELEALKAIKILNFTGVESFKEIKTRYLDLSRLFHPDCNGHPAAFNILNRAYTIFKEAYFNEKEN